MKILITNVAFDKYAGTEVVVRDLAFAFLSLGHEPIVFSLQLGRIAEEVRTAGIHVTDDLSTLGSPPDIIHGHHHRALIEALLRFPDTPAIYVCHDATSVMDEPIFFPRIRRYLAVDERCRSRIQQALGAKSGEIGIMPNAVDLLRFQPRSPLPAQPRKAVVFSNYANGGTHLKAIKAACRQAGLFMDVMGEAAGTQCATPEQSLPNYDLVFAKGRCALEALAVGNAVVLCDFAGTGSYVTSDQFDHFRRMNFGRSLLTKPLNPKTIGKEIARYDSNDAAEVTRRTRAGAGVALASTEWIKLYTEVLNAFNAEDVDRAAEYQAVADYLGAWHYLKRRDWEIQQLDRLKAIPLIGKPVFQFARQKLKQLLLRESGSGRSH